MSYTKNSVHILTIEGYSSQGEGVGRLEGMAVFVKGGLRGETLRVALTKVDKRCAWARIVEVLTPSPARVEPDCPHYKLCGGCSLRHMSYEEELAFKQQRVDDALERIGGLSLRTEAIHGAADVFRYRNKAVFPVSADGKGGVNVGFFRQRSHQVVDVPSCLIQSPDADRAARSVREWMLEWKVPPYDESALSGLIRHVFVRTNRRGESLICVVANASSLPHEAELVRSLRKACPKAVGIVLNRNERDTNVILGQEYRTLWGRSWIEDRLCGLSFRLSVPSFFQVNRDQAERLYNCALDFAALTGTETVVDLYCGTGTISLVMARKAAKVIGAEIVAPAVENARENAKRNGFENSEFLCADAGEAAQELARRGIRPDVVCVDPPRKGISPQVIDAIETMAPKRVVYVSCNPATLARDLKILKERGYCGVRALAFDLFPRTCHVETVVLLTRNT
jgi:23S rRNA (uracil1939-C5)-methyltransferase